MDHSDPLGLYRALGLSPTATADEIAVAFRKRSKETHPDTSGRESAEEFVQVSAAYEVLGDPARREKYDRSSWEPFKRDVEAQKGREQKSEFHGDWGQIRIDPICCDFCGKVTAQPRYLTFSILISLVVWAHVERASGIFCVRCARLKGVLYSLITMVTGWWLIPGGPYYTVLTILQNGFETERMKEDDYRLILHNVDAFQSRGNLELAYSLARIASQSRDISISRQAEMFIKRIDNSYPGYQAQKLANAWGNTSFWDLSHVIIAFILPISFGLFLFINSTTGTSWDINDRLYPRIAQTDPAFCKNPPRSGQAIGPRPPMQRGARILIHNNSRYDMIVKLRDVKSNHVAAALFIGVWQDAWAYPVPAGEYMVQYAAGEDFDESCSKFVNFERINALRQNIHVNSYILKNKEEIFVSLDKVVIDDIHDFVEYHTVGRHLEAIYYPTFSAEEFNLP